MDILAKLRVLFWGLVIGLWGLFMYQYMSEDMSALKRFKVTKNPFAGVLPADRPVLKKYPPAAPFRPARPPEQTAPGEGKLGGQGTVDLVKAGADIKDIASVPLMTEKTDREKAAGAAAADFSSYPPPPDGFSVKETPHFVVYEEGPEVRRETVDTLESLHGNIMLDLVAFSPWTREKKVFIYYAQSAKTYRKLTGRPEWSGGAASLGERKIYVYKSDEAFGILAHELTHIYFDSFFPASRPSPLWLSEGIATYIQSERGMSTPEWLQQNLQLLEGGSGFKLNDLVRIDSMQGADEDNVRLWYAESYSVVRFLMKLKAGDAFYVFCKELRDGKPAHQALYRAYGMPYNRLASLEYAWRYDLKTGKISGLRR
ncbi:MAG: peptidase MA family metallohydrolase [Elusimicrobia bacterium]|nr:peptidase MA family metallohydrolase [Elusimicrobiota bacterium]